MTTTTMVCFGCCSSYTLGLFFILLVSLIWSAASILVQFLYTDKSFDSPFLLTYIGVSLFTLLLPTKAAFEQGKVAFNYVCAKRSLASRVEMGNYEHVPSVEHSIGGGGGVGEEPFHDEGVCGDEPSYDSDDDNQDDDDDQSQGRSNNISNDANANGLVRIIASPGDNDNETERPWTNRDHMVAAVKIAPVWFLANWTYNASLAYTSITSSTVLASTGSLFTFLFAIFTRDEKFSCLKFVGILLGVSGSIFTALHDADSSNDEYPTSSNNNTMIYIIEEDGDVQGLSDTPPPLHARIRMMRQLLAGYRDIGDIIQEPALFGDILGLISAVGYGAYTVMVRVLCPHNESLMSMELLLGYIGLFNMVALSPILFYQLFDGKHSELTWVVFGFLVVKGLLDNVLSDYLWARAVLLTSATVATVGVGLTIPLAFLSDVLWMGQDGDTVVTFSSVAGALSVLTGFVLVNYSTAHGEKGEEHVRAGAVEEEDEADHVTSSEMVRVS